MAFIELEFLEGKAITPLRLGLLEPLETRTPPMRILIDGYNLLFQSQLVGKGRAVGWLDRARKRLIAHLHATLGEDLLQQTFVVFDASQVGDTGADFQSDRGVKVIFARQHPEADDLLEELIRKHSSPKRLMVVSSDQRIGRCARARRAQLTTSASFLRGLEEHRWSALDGVRSEPLDRLDHPSRGQTLSQDQVEFWLREFGQQ